MTLAEAADPNRYSALSPAERRILAEVTRSGRRTYNGRVRQQIVNLRDAGYVDADFDLVLGADHNSRWVITVTPRGHR